MSRSRVPKILRTNVREAALKKVMISRAQGQSVRKLMSERMNEISHYSSNEFVYILYIYNLAPFLAGRLMWWYDESC